jgi:predicted Zn-dependent protease
MLSRFAIVLLATLPLAAQRPAGAGVNFYSLEKEAALGKQLAADYRQKVAVLESPAAQDYLDHLGQRIAAQLPEPKWTFSFTLMAGDEGGSTREPTALPAGYVFVPAGLVLAARDEAEFAGMVAHAMAHITARDWTRQATRGELTQISMVAAQAAEQNGANRMNADSLRRSSDMQMPLMVIAMARNSHLAADALGAKAIAQAGLNPEALVRYLDREQRDQTGTMAASFADLPDRDARLSALRTLIAGRPAANYASPGREYAAFQAEVRRLAANPPAPALKPEKEK